MKYSLEEIREHSSILKRFAQEMSEISVSLQESLNDKLSKNGQSVLDTVSEASSNVSQSTLHFIDICKSDDIGKYFEFYDISYDSIEDTISDLLSQISELKSMINSNYSSFTLKQANFTLQNSQESGLIYEDIVGLASHLDRCADDLEQDASQSFDDIEFFYKSSDYLCDAIDEYVNLINSQLRKFVGTKFMNDDCYSSLISHLGKVKSFIHDSLVNG